MPRESQRRERPCTFFICPFYWAANERRRGAAALPLRGAQLLHLTRGRSEEDACASSAAGVGPGGTSVLRRPLDSRVSPPTLLSGRRH